MTMTPDNYVDNAISSMYMLQLHSVHARTAPELFKLKCANGGRN